MGLTMYGFTELAKGIWVKDILGGKWTAIKLNSHVLSELFRAVVMSNCTVSILTFLAAHQLCMLVPHDAVIPLSQPR